MSIEKVGNKLPKKRKVGRPKSGQTKEKISVSVDKKVLQTSLAKWQNRASTSGLVEWLMRQYAAGSLLKEAT
jgi:hypothetical protein